ncbi:MAG: hypothetical protein KF723_22420 [Rhizobiaceae bacterium]|nr:hypothetical protein [Rhizobiaceae bacterium]
MTAFTFNAEAFRLFVCWRKDNPKQQSMLEAAAEAGVVKDQLFRAMHKQRVGVEAFLSLCLWMDINPYAFLLDKETGRGLAPLPDGKVPHDQRGQTRSAPQFSEAAQ